MIKLVAFDLDGTIGNTIPMCIKAIKKAVGPYVMRELSDIEIIRTFGVNEEGMTKRLVDNDSWENALKDFYIVYSEMHELCPQPFSGILDLIKELKAKEIPIALITGRGEKSCDITLSRFGMQNCFDQIITGNPLKNTKSAAIGYLLHRYNLHPCEMVYIGDAVSDISACIEAGISCLSAAWATPNKITLSLEENNRGRVFYSIHSLRTFLMSHLCDS